MIRQLLPIKIIPDPLPPEAIAAIEEDLEYTGPPSTITQLPVGLDVDELLRVFMKRLRSIIGD